MNTDGTKPSVAPKTRFVCHANLKLPPPLMSATKRPKPFISPKPKVTLELNGNQGRCSDGTLLTSDGKLAEHNETENGVNKGITAEEQCHTSILKSQNVSQGLADGEVTEEEKEMQEDMSQKMDEDWRLSDSAFTVEVDSLETLWVTSELSDSKEAVELMDTDLTENMDTEGCDAGEALADTDGLSVGDISFNSIDEEAGGSSVERQKMKERLEKHQIKEDEASDCTADDLTESLIDDVHILTNENITDSNTKQVFPSGGGEKDEETVSNCGITCNILKLRCGCKMKEKGERLQNISFYDSGAGDRKHFCDATKGHIVIEDDTIHEPYYVSSDDIIKKETMPRNKKADGLSDSPQTPHTLSVNGSGVSIGNNKENGQIQCVSSEDYIKTGNSPGFSHNNGDENKVRRCQKWPSFKTEEHRAHTAEALLNDFDCQPRFRLVSISVPSDTDTSLTSSLSESQLLSPNDSDIFREDEDLEGYIVPLMDDTTDTEQDIDDEPIYEEPRKSLKGANRKTTGMQSHSLSHSVNNNVAEMGVQFVQSPYLSGFGQPALSSSPMLNSVRNKSYSKPHYLSLYPRSLSMEAPDKPLLFYREGHESQRQREAIFSSGSFSRCSPLSSSGLSTPTSVVDIPPPFELACITKKPITKSSPSLLIAGDSSEKNRKKKSSLKHFLMLKFRRKTENKSVVDVNPSSSKSSTESSPRTPNRLLDLDSHSLSSSPQLSSRSTSKLEASSESASSFLFYKESKRKGGSVAFLNRSVIRVESFEDRTRVPFVPLPLTKPRSISFPNTNTSDYENVPAVSSDYENVHVPQTRQIPQGPFTSFFDRPSRGQSTANDTDGYVDMSSLPGFKGKIQSAEDETDSAYTEAYNVCSVAVSPLVGSVGEVRGETPREEDQARTSDEEDGVTNITYNKQTDGRSRAFYVAKELVDTERMHVKALKLLQEDFREAVGAAVGEEGEPVLEEERLREILNELPDVYTLHRRILTELENRLRHWEESQKIADIFLTRKAEFLVFTTYIGHYDRSMNLLEESCRTSPGFAAIVLQFEKLDKLHTEATILAHRVFELPTMAKLNIFRALMQSPFGEKVSLKHQLLRVIVRVAQYRMLLTDYLNNLSPDSKEYEDTQAAVVMVSDIGDQVNDSLKHGENLLRLVNIEYSVHGQRDLLQPGRVFVKEGTLMKVSRKSQQPRHLFLMNDVLLYTYPQQDGKYRLKNTLPLSGLKVSKPIIENVQNALKIDGTNVSITLTASSFLEREDWFYTLSRTVAEHTRGSPAFNSCSGEARDCLHLSLGEKAPTLVPVSQVMMCMNCTADFSLTLRRHHCHGCGRIVCRSCSRNRYPLKYMKDHMAKVCDHCYSELKKRGDLSAGKNSPRPNRSSRPLSAVFQNIHPPNIWRHRKGTLSFNQVTVSEEGSVSGSLQRSKKSKRNWKRLWFHLKDKVLYTYRAQEEKIASESLPLLGFTVKLPDRPEGQEEANVFQLYHKNTLYYTFKAEDNYTARRWANAMEEATVL